MDPTQLAPRDYKRVKLYLLEDTILNNEYCPFQHASCRERREEEIIMDNGIVWCQTIRTKDLEGGFFCSSGIQHIMEKQDWRANAF